ncbi:MAG: sulfatase [Bryobacteraceae bacterium]|nr:sulfatase [Bryobacteraceae bacterium]
MRAWLPLALLGLLAPAQTGFGADKPNVLMIAVDDWNDWVAALGGHPQVKTPNLDRLASRGILFTDAHTASPLCNPSRTAVMTGRLPSRSGVYDNDQVWRTAMPDVVTLPQYFKAHGYRVEGAGKVFHHGRGFNDPRSWDNYFFWNPKARANAWHDDYSFPPDPEPARPVTPMPTVSWRNFDWAPLDVAEEEMPDWKVSSWAAEFLGKKHDRPFFLAAGIFRPHIPWFVPRKYFEMYPLDEVVVPTIKEDDLADLPPAAWKMALNEFSRHDLLVATGNFKKAVQAYLACISFADAMAGRILDALEKSEYRDNTIVMLWSDHGYHLGEKWHWHKQALWDRATHVPFMVAAPGVTKAGSRTTQPVSLLHVYPTLADLAGLPPPDGVDGVSLRPLLEDPNRAWEQPALITFLRGNHALRSERWSYIRYADGGEELYDRRQDPNEWMNLAGQADKAPVKDKLRKWLPAADAPDAPRMRDYSLDPATVTWTRK